MPELTEPVHSRAEITAQRPESRSLALATWFRSPSQRALEKATIGGANKKTGTAAVQVLQERDTGKNLALPKGRSDLCPWPLGDNL